MQDKNTCPICRKPLDQTAPPANKIGEQQQQQQQQQQRQQTFGQDMLAAEMAFRLTNLHRCGRLWGIVVLQLACC